MTTHVKVLGALLIAVSALGLLTAVFVMLTFGFSAAIVGMAADPLDAEVAQPVLAVVGTALTSFILVLSLPGMIVGWGLMKFRPWARILGIVLAVLNLINVPLGTAIGLYGLWVLFHSDTERLFSPAVHPDLSRGL